jgi:hypothetical protein
LFSGQLQALRDGLEKKSGELEILRFETCKFGVLYIEPSYLLVCVSRVTLAKRVQALSGTLSEPDEALMASLKFLLEAFCFYHGSFTAIKDVSVQILFGARKSHEIVCPNGSQAVFERHDSHLVQLIDLLPRSWRHDLLFFLLYSLL